MTWSAGALDSAQGRAIARNGPGHTSTEGHDMTRRVLVVFGTRPEAIKLAPVVAELAARDGFQPIVAVTAQHREMLDQVLQLFDIAPDYDLDIMQPGQTLTDITVKSVSGLTPLVDRTRPHAVLVQGDTTTTFAAALTAFYHKVPVGHVEAGLRTGDIYRPYPEEANRRLTTRLTRWHFPPTATSAAHLLDEGVPPTTSPSPATPSSTRCCTCAICPTSSRWVTP